MKALWALAASELVSAILMLTAGLWPHLLPWLWMRLFCVATGALGLALSSYTFGKAFTYWSRRKLHHDLARDYEKLFEEEAQRNAGVAGDHGHRDRTSVPRQP